ncbi:uncharacterized protein LOC118348276 [Juglans regia]|uniref:Uncharacterized protein LOC118348276 n=1 Tax=Juglans regia TaxID=51240 RepID=A0A6P9EB57_JUGRE|nr:uncharacterized protein LOC118348276 [Juglans regia]
MGPGRYTDTKGTVNFYVKEKLMTLHDHRVLFHADGNPIVILREKIMSAHDRWNVYRGKSKEPNDLIFTVKRSSMIQMRAKLHVFLANNTNEEDRAQRSKEIKSAPEDYIPSPFARSSSPNHPSRPRTAGRESPHSEPETHPYSTSISLSALPFLLVFSLSLCVCNVVREPDELGIKSLRSDSLLPHRTRAPCSIPSLLNDFDIQQQHSRLIPTTLFITGPQTRSFKRYYLRSSTRASREVRSQWKKFRTNGCRDYDLLCTIFGQSVATGVCHFVSTQQPPTSEEEDRLEEEVRARGPVLGTATDAPIDLDGPNIDGPARRQRQARRRRREPVRSSISSQFSKTLEVMAATTAMRNELDKQFLKECSRKRSKGDETEFGSDASYSKLGVAMKFLDEITPPLPAHQYNKAVEKFMHDKAVEAFLMMPPNRKIDWIWGLQ